MKGQDLLGSKAHHYLFVESDEDEVNVCIHDILEK